MRVILYDGSSIECDKIWVSKNGFIIDGHRIVPFLCVLRIERDDTI